MSTGANDARQEIARLRSAVRGVLPRILERAVDAEHNLAIPEENLADLEGTGAHRFLEPREKGGYGLPLEPFLQIVMEIATVCGSTAWTFMHFAAHNYVVQFQPDKVHALVYGDGRPARIASSFIDGGELVADANGTHSLSGSWPYVTGVHLADWIIVNAHKNDGSEVKVFVDAADVAVTKDWDTLGMRGTASHSIEIEKLVIPDNQVVFSSESESSFHDKAKALKVNVLPMPAMIALGTVTPILGMTRSCLNQYGNLLRKWAGEEKLLPGSLERYARLNTQGAALELLQRESVRILDRSVHGRRLTGDDESSVRMNASWIARSCREMVSEMLGAGGTRSLYCDHPMARHAAGVFTLCTHFFIDYDRLSVNHGALLLRSRNG